MALIVSSVCPQALVGENPNHGYTNFDNFLWSMLTTFQLITLDYWENVYNMVLASCGPLSVVFFTVVVFFGSFYLINLMLAVVALSYEEEAEITNEERRKDLTDHRDDSTFSFDPSNIPVKTLEKCNRKKIDSRKGVLLSSYSRKKTRRRKRRGGVSGAGVETSTAGSRSVTPSPRHSFAEPVASPPPPPPLPPPVVPNPDTLHPGRINRGQLSSRQGSSNNSDGNNRESSLDDSGVVDDHEEADGTSEDVTNLLLHSLGQQKVDPVTVPPLPTHREKEVKVIKCNGVSPLHTVQKPPVYTLPSADYMSQVVVLVSQEHSIQLRSRPEIERDDLVDRNCDKCIECCVDYEGWLRIQNCLYKVVRDPLFELLITLCIILNTMFLATEHHGMSENIRSALDIGNKVFTSIFTLECTLKLMALSKEFFACGWNIFDLIIVSASLLDLSFELVDGLSVLRGLRLLRVLKLAQSWTTMKVLLSIIISTIGALGNLTFVLVIVIYIFAVIGMQLFSKDYTAEKFAPDPVPRWNFSDFFHSFMMIFRILCGEWIEPLWDCMRAEKIEGPGTCFAIFLPALVMGNFMVLNLFLALLLNSFNSEELKSKKEPEYLEEDAEVAEMKALWSHHMQVAARFCGQCGLPFSPTSPPPVVTHLGSRPRHFDPPLHPIHSSPPRASIKSKSLPTFQISPLPKRNLVTLSAPARVIFSDNKPSRTSVHLVKTPVVSKTNMKCSVTKEDRSSELPGKTLLTHPDPKTPEPLAPWEEEVGEESKIARSFERIKSIIAKNKRKRKELAEKNENEKNFRLEELVKEVVAQKKDCGVQETAICNSPRDSARYTDDRAYCQTIQQVMEGKSRVDLQCYQQNTPSSHSTPQRNSGYYEVASPPTPRLHVEVCKTPSPLCEVIPLHGDEVKVQIEEDSEEERKEIDIKEDELYTSIMAEAMSFAPTLSAPDLDLPSVDDSPKFVERRRSLSSPVNTLHRRSYQLATRRESSEGELIK
ncbi:Sodium channel protein 60E [Homalodisca vitripennis]|nr:Sodium channel protein 60E [Homalodisca vitripennis]